MQITSSSLSVWAYTMPAMDCARSTRAFTHVGCGLANQYQDTGLLVTEPYSGRASHHRNGKGSPAAAQSNNKLCPCSASTGPASAPRRRQLLALQAYGRVAAVLALQLRHHLLWSAAHFRRAAPACGFAAV